MEKEKIKLRNKRERGITLVALVITIIVLIILAGVSINAVMNGGLITNAKDARDEYDKAKRKEGISLNQLEMDKMQIEFLKQGIPYNYKQGYITGINEETTVESFLSRIPNNEEYKVYVYNESTEAFEEVPTTVYVGTGMVLKKGTQEIGALVILGDVNADGIIDMVDTGWIYTEMSNKGQLGNAKRVAADANCDGYIDLEDIAIIQKEYVISGTINQNSKPLDVTNIITRTEEEWIESKAEKLQETLGDNFIKTEWTYDEEGNPEFYEMYLKTDTTITGRDVRNILKGEIYTVLIKDQDGKPALSSNIGNGYIADFDNTTINIKFIIE